MRYTSTSIIAVAITALFQETLAAPSGTRNTGFLARHHRRHFQSNNLKRTDPVVSISNWFLATSHAHNSYPTATTASTPPAYATAKSVDTSVQKSNPACHLLLDVYYSMGGEEWTNQYGWDQARRHISLNTSRLENLGCCDWYGVTCSPDGEKVVALELPNNGLSGRISDSVYLLPDLQILNISSNPLFTTLSPMLMAIPIIDLSHASLYGKVPPSVFQSPTTKILLLSNNTFTGPIDVSGAVNVETLFLDTNYFSGVTLGPSQGKKWKSLVMYNNMIHVPLPDLSGAMDLERVAFGNNRFTGSVFDVANLKKLMYLDLRANLLSGPLPPLHLFNLPSLRLLGLGGNSFTGPVELENAQHTLIAAPSTIQKCSLNGQAEELILPCDNLPESYPSYTWAAKCGIIRICNRRKLAFKPM